MDRIDIFTTQAEWSCTLASVKSIEVMPNESFETAERVLARGVAMDFFLGGYKSFWWV